MSKSLRTRPQTLYQQDQQGGSYAGAHGPAPAQGNRPRVPSAARDHPPSARAGQGAVKGSVSSNLKKRLSTRYRDGNDTLQSHVYRMAGDASIPQVPELPSMHIHANQSAVVNAALSIPGFSLGGISNAAVDEPADAVEVQVASTSRPQRRERDLRHLSVFAKADGRQPLDQLLQEASTTVQNDRMDELQIMAAERFEPLAYLRAVSAGGEMNETSAQQARDTLHSLKKTAASRLQGSVYANYTHFLNLSKEVASLENDMLELKELLRDWLTLPGSIDAGDTAHSQQPQALGTNGVSMVGGVNALVTSETARVNHRNSVQDLAQIYKAQLQALWDNIEGSHRFVTAAPGRHLIAEASNFVELNSATYRPKQPVALFLLDDLLLVASRKRRQTGSKVQMTAEKCFNLAEIVVIDLKDAADLSNAVKIKRGKEVYVYRTDRLEEKKSLLGAFRRVAEELAAKRRQSMQPESERAKDLPELLSQPDGRADAQKDGGGTAWLVEWSDQLVTAIAVQRWEQAINLVEKGRDLRDGCSKGDPLYEQIDSRLRDQTEVLITSLAAVLSSPFNRKTAVVQYAGWMLRLGRGEHARDIFLSARSDLLRRRSRQIRFEGDVSLYISELVLVYFTIIKNTSEWYMSAFKDNKMASGFVKWASLQMESFADKFRKQIYGSITAAAMPDDVQEALDITYRSAAQLRDVGLDFTFLLEDLLKPEDSVQSSKTVESR